MPESTDPKPDGIVRIWASGRNPAEVDRLLPPDRRPKSVRQRDARLLGRAILDAVNGKAGR